MNKRIFSLSLLIGWLLLFLCMGDVSAAGETGGGYLAGYEEADPRPSAVSWWSTVAYVVSLFAVFAFVVILAYFAARAFGKNSMQRLAARGGQIYLQLPLGPNRSVCVVELFGRVFVLGVTDANIHLITEIDDPETVDEIRSSEPAGGGVFQEQFGSLSDFVQKIPPLFRK
ncbi:flagellar biosynthetic protein FliO [Selenomonas timonae]|uniref:Flagellar biosynthetic protein FliO n=1 Tax=Selenomonas timonae TaxID=2754044 RepID=A0A7G7VMM5_9FIRM|nr:flagellar biosynthetic protein FliO [Selenomonas timonae]QNH55368.1 flagellar biosynthetic protein FliO [Selenomonas timonae]